MRPLSFPFPDARRIAFARILGKNSISVDFIAASPVFITHCEVTGLQDEDFGRLDFVVVRDWVADIHGKLCRAIDLCEKSFDGRGWVLVCFDLFLVCLQVQRTKLTIFVEEEIEDLLKGTVGTTYK